MKFDKLLICGDSYMQCFIRVNGHKLLAKKLGIDKVDYIVRSGSSIEYIIRSVIEYLLKNTQETILVVWGLTFINRFDMLTVDHSNNYAGEWTSFNGGNLTFGNILKEKIFEYRSVLAAARCIARIREMNKSIVLKDYIDKIITTTAFIEKQGHDFIIFSQGKLETEDAVAEQYQKDLINQDNRYYDIFGLAMNKHLQDLGVPVSANDIRNYPDLDRALMHPEETDALAETLSAVLVEKYNEIFNGKSAT